MKNLCVSNVTYPWIEGIQRDVTLDQPYPRLGRPYCILYFFLNKNRRYWLSAICLHILNRTTMVHLKLLLCFCYTQINNNKRRPCFFLPTPKKPLRACVIKKFSAQLPDSETIQIIRIHFLNEEINKQTKIMYFLVYIYVHKKSRSWQLCKKVA